MRCDSVKELQGAAFRRLTGVRRSTFEDLAAVLFAAKCRRNHDPRPLHRHRRQALPLEGHS